MRSLVAAAILLAALPASARLSTKKLLAAFEQGKVEDRIRLAPALGRIKDGRATQLLIERLDPRKGNPKETAALVQGLGYTEDTLAVQPLIQAWDYMRTTDMQLEGEMPAHLQVLRWRILEALGRIGGEQAVATLSAALNESDPRVVEEAARGLGKLKVKDAVPALQQLAAKGGNVGQTAIEALGEIGDKRAVSALEPLLAGSDPYVEVQALYALAKLGQRQRIKDLEKQLEGDPGERGAAVMAAFYLIKLDRNSGLHYLDGLLKKNDPNLSVIAAEALGKTNNERAVLPLAESLDSKDQAVRHMSVRGLSRLGGARALGALKKLRDDPHPNVRAAALAGLDEWGERD
jgi:HEAT repeat protein